MPVRRDKRTRRWFFRTVVKLTDGTKRRVSGTPGSPGPYQDLSNTRAGAEEAEHRAIAAAKGEQPGVPLQQPKEVPTLRDFAENFYLPKMRTIGNKKGKNKPATLDAKESHLRVHLYPRFGDMPIDRVDEIAVEDLKLALGELGRSPKTINNVLTTLHNILRNAKKRKLIKAVPDIEWLRVGEQGFDFLDFEEADRLLAGAAKVPEWTCAVLLALKSGLRLGELRALRWSDVDLVASKVTVRRNLWRNHEGTPKNGKSRTVDLPSSAVSALKEHRHLRGDRVFLDPDGRDYSIGAWRHGLYRSCRRAGLRDVGWHTLRHSFASHLVMRGATFKEVQELMGHGTIAMTLRYSHLAPGATAAAVAKLDEPAPSWQQMAAAAKSGGN